MILTLKLNLGANNYENQEFQTNEYDNIEDCYREQIIFLNGWLDFTSFAQPLLEHIQKILGEKPSMAEVSYNHRFPKGETFEHQFDPVEHQQNTSATIHDQKIMREMIPKADVIIQDVLEDEKSDPVRVVGGSGTAPSINHERAAASDSMPSKLQEYTGKVLDSDTFSLTAMTEAVMQDLKGVMIQFYTDKSVLVVKNSYKKWVAFSLMANSTIKNDIEALKGTTVDVFLTDKAEKWFHKKPWEEYKEVEKS